MASFISRSVSSRVRPVVMQQNSRRANDGEACFAPTTELQRETIPKRIFIGKFMQPQSCDIGLIGLAVMGQTLVLNMNDRGYRRQNAALDTASAPVSVVLVIQVSRDVREYLPFIAKAGSAVAALVAGETGEAAAIIYSSEVSVIK